MDIVYKIEKTLDPKEFIGILERSGLAERRPVSNEEIINKMCANANLVITCRLNDKLIGIARSVTDFGFCTYLSDLAVDKEYQHAGIGKRLIDETKKAVPAATLILLSAPAAINYYPKIGMKQFDGCFILKPGEQLTL